MSLGIFLLLSKKHSDRHFLSEQCCFVNIKYLRSTIATLFNQLANFSGKVEAASMSTLAATRETKDRLSEGTFLGPVLFL
jgi:hypothetical protein